MVYINDSTATAFSVEDSHTADVPLEFCGCTGNTRQRQAQRCQIFVSPLEVTHHMISYQEGLSGDVRSSRSEERG